MNMNCHRTAVHGGRKIWNFGFIEGGYAFGHVMVCITYGTSFKGRGRRSMIFFEDEEAARTWQMAMTETFTDEVALVTCERCQRVTFNSWPNVRQSLVAIA